MKVKFFIVALTGLGVSLIMGSAIFLVGRAGTQTTQDQPPIEESNKLPGFILPDLAGEFHNTSELNGNPAVINFWATWCRPCEEEMPLLQSYAEKYQVVSFIGVNSGEEAALVEPFINKYDITFSIWLDADKEVTEKMQIIGLPTTYFIDSSGTIKAIHLGQLSPELLDQNLQRLGIKP